MGVVNRLEKKANKHTRTGHFTGLDYFQHVVYISLCVCANCMQEWFHSNNNSTTKKNELYLSLSSIFLVFIVAHNFSFQVENVQTSYSKFQKQAAGLDFKTIHCSHIRTRIYRI